MSEFSKHKGRRDGLQDFCKECSRAAALQYYHKLKAKKLEVNVADAPDEPSIILTPVSLNSFSSNDLIAELQRRGIVVLVNPKPRDLMTELKKAGYTGTLEYYEKRTVNLNSNF